MNTSVPTEAFRSYALGNYPLDVGRLIIDHRLGAIPRYRIVRGDDDLMQLPDEIRKCVVFLCYVDRQGNKRLAGTGFFTSVRVDELDGSFHYLVTAKHVLDGIRRESSDQKVLIRVNFTDRPSDFIQSDLADWRYHPTEEYAVDAAVLPIRPMVGANVDYLVIPDRLALTDAIIQEEKVAVGDDVFTVGLFVNHAGRQRNLPIVRVGNIALMPEERVYSGQVFGEMDAYLIEVRSLGGLSGSPVFVNLSGMRRLGDGRGRQDFLRYYWLGVMHGHWNSRPSDDDVLSEETPDGEPLNKGIALVVPATKILEILNGDELKGRRDRVIQDERNKKAPQADSVEAEPFTREHFEDALKKVSRRRSRPSQPDEALSET